MQTSSRVHHERLPGLTYLVHECLKPDFNAVIILPFAGVIDPGYIVVILPEAISEDRGNRSGYAGEWKDIGHF